MYIASLINVKEVITFITGPQTADESTLVRASRAHHCFTAVFGKLRTLTFKRQPPNCVFTSVNQNQKSQIRRIIDTKMKA